MSVDKNQISNERLGILLNQYGYNYKSSALGFKNTCIANLHYLKTEILGNLAILPKENQIPYLTQVNHELKALWQPVEDAYSMVVPWLEKYGFETVDQIKGGTTASELYDIISSEPTQDHEMGLGHPFFNAIHSTFYDYYDTFYIDVACKFVEELLIQQKPIGYLVNEKASIMGDYKAAANENIINKETLSNPQPVLSTNLTVPQISVFYNGLNRIKPAIFNIGTLKQLYAFISATHTTKQSKNDRISTAKLSQNFSNPDPAAIDFWIDRAHEFISILKKMKKS